MMSTLAASITSYFVQQTSNTDAKDFAKRLDRIERMLERLGRDKYVGYATGELDSGVPANSEEAELLLMSGSE
jgi:hypothetical protein